MFTEIKKGICLHNWLDNNLKEKCLRNFCYKKLYR